MDTIVVLAIASDFCPQPYLISTTTKEEEEIYYRQRGQSPIPFIPERPLRLSIFRSTIPTGDDGSFMVTPHCTHTETETDPRVRYLKLA